MNNQIPEASSEASSEAHPNNPTSSLPNNFNAGHEILSGNTATVTITQTTTSTNEEEVLPLTLRARPNVTW